MVDAPKKRGGKRPGSGRKKGTPNKVTTDIKAVAQLHGEAAITRLVHLMTKGKSERAQVAACKELLDRGYGKPTQTLASEDGKPLMQPVINITVGNERTAHGSEGAQPGLTPAPEAGRSAKH